VYNNILNDQLIYYYSQYILHFILAKFQNQSIIDGFLHVINFLIIWNTTKISFRLGTRMGTLKYYRILFTHHIMYNYNLCTYML